MDFSFLPIASAASPLLDASVSYTTTDMVRITIAMIVMVAILCAIVFIIWGGLMLILSGWDSGKVSSAIWSIRYSVIGIVVIVVAIFLIPRVAELLGFGSFDYLSPKNILDTVQILLGRIFGVSTTSAPTSFDGF